MKDKLSHQSLNITSFSNAIVKVLWHIVTLFVTLIRIITGCALTFVNLGVGWSRTAG